jgi:hypothetical protein
MTNAAKQQWPNMSKDQRAMELAKTAIGWDKMTPEEQTQAVGYLAKLANEFKEAL